MSSIYSHMQRIRNKFQFTPKLVPKTEKPSGKLPNQIDQMPGNSSKTLTRVISPIARHSAKTKQNRKKEKHEGKKHTKIGRGGMAAAAAAANKGELPRYKTRESVLETVTREAQVVSPLSPRTFTSSSYFAPADFSAATAFFPPAASAHFIRPVTDPCRDNNHC